MVEVETPREVEASAERPAERPARSGGRLLTLAAIGSVVLVLLAAFVSARRFFRPRQVTAGVLRSGQPRPKDLERTKADVELKSVVNLRGENRAADWWRAESAACERLGLPLRNVRLETFDWPARREMLALVDALDHLPRPILLHCSGGSDRSGLASAVARMLEGETPDAALGELGPASGHVCRRESCSLHRFVERYVGFLAASGKSHSGATFREWVTNRYAPPPYDAAIRLVSPVPARAEAGLRVPIEVEVENRSELPWKLSSSKPRGIRLGVRSIGPLGASPEKLVARFLAGRKDAVDLLRIGIEDGVVPPGASRRFSGELRLPSTPGAHLVQVDLVDENVHWFSDLGYDGVVVPVEIVSPGQLAESARSSAR